MKKITSLLASSLVFSSCGKVVKAKDESAFTKQIEDKKIDTPDTSEFKEALGYKKIGVAGFTLNQSLSGLEIKNEVNSWTYNWDNKKMGNKYAFVSGKKQLASSDSYNSGKNTSAINSYEFKQNVAILKQTLISLTNIGTLSSTNKLIVLPTVASSNEVFSDEFVSKLYIALHDETAITSRKIMTKMKLIKRFLGNGASDIGLVADTDSGGSFYFKTDEASVLFTQNGLNQAINPQGYSPFSTLLTPTKSNELIKEDLTSKEFGLNQKNLDALFIQVKDGVHNTEDVYKAVKEKNNFKDTNLIFIGEKAKSQNGASAKTFAGNKITTGTYNKYASAYIAGYKSAIMQLKWSQSEQKFEETQIAFLIGSISDTSAKKKAFAFRQGVEAASKNKTFSQYLKIKFVSKVQDSSKSSKKLNYEISGWKEINDSKTKLYEFTSSETFSDAEKKVVYIAGTTAKDWRGSSTNSTQNQWNKNDDTGLVGAMFNYQEIKNNNTEDSALSAKTFSNGISIVLDNIIKTDNSSDDVEADNTKINRRNVKVLGTLGTEAIAIGSYVENIIKGLYLEKDARRIGKHSIFGSDIILVEKLNWVNSKLRNRNKLINDSVQDALNAMPLTQDELTKSSSWMK